MIVWLYELVIQVDSSMGSIEWDGKIESLIEVSSLSNVKSTLVSMSSSWLCNEAAGPLIDWNELTVQYLPTGPNSIKIIKIIKMIKLQS